MALQNREGALLMEGSRSLETVMRVLRRVTGLRIVLVAQMTGSEWTACSVLDDAGYGIEPGDKLTLSDTY